MADRVLVETSPQLSSSIPAQTGIDDTAEVVLLPNPRRKGFIIQNTGTTIIKLAFGAVESEPSGTAYHVALKACSLANDGTGGLYMDDAWVGGVWGISSAAGGTCVICEFQAGATNWSQAMGFES